MVSIRQEDGLFILTFPVAFNLENTEKLESLLSQVENYPSPTALIITSNHPKIFNAGMDTKSIMENGLASAIKIGEALMRLVARIMKLKCPTISCINGHCIAAGFIIASGTDYKIKRNDFGYIQLNEILNGIILTSGSSRILTATLHPCVHRDMVLRGIRYDTEMALRDKIIDEACELQDLMKRCKEKAREMIADLVEGRKNVVEIRKDKFKLAIEVCQKGEFDKEFVDEMLNPKV